MYLPPLPHLTQSLPRRTRRVVNQFYPCRQIVRRKHMLRALPADLTRQPLVLEEVLDELLRRRQRRDVAHDEEVCSRLAGTELVAQVAHAVVWVGCFGGGVAGEAGGGGLLHGDGVGPVGARFVVDGLVEGNGVAGDGEVCATRGGVSVCRKMYQTETWSRFRRGAL
jgi:hypothetical protein